MAGTPPTPSPQNQPKTFQTERWAAARIRPEWDIAIDKVIYNSIRNKDKYEGVAQNKMPWFVIAGLHMRESSSSWTKHLHEGSPLNRRTQYVPKGRLPDKPPPYTWEESANDALFILKKMQNIKWGDLHESLQAIEKYNGLGYQKYHPDTPSPYLWSSTTAYKRGKYVADGKFDPMVVDKQIGVAALIKRMVERGLIKNTCFN